MRSKNKLCSYIVITSRFIYSYYRVDEKANYSVQGLALNSLAITVLLVFLIICPLSFHRCASQLTQGKQNGRWFSPLASS